MNVTVTQILRPIKLAFLIHPNRKSSYIRALQISSSFWGGKHFPIIPLYKKFSQEYRKEYHLLIKSPIEFYKNILANFNPDFLIVDEGLDNDYIKAIRNNRRIVPISEVESSILNNDTEYGISIHEVLQTIKETEFMNHRTDSLKVCCPRIGITDIFTMTLCGNINANFLKKIKEIEFPKKYISYLRINRNKLDRCVGDNILNYLSLGTYKTETYGNPLWTSEFAIYFANPEHLNDLINIWNYRALGWNILVIPDGSLNEPYFHQQIEKQQIEFHKYRRLTERITVMVHYKISRENVHSYLTQLSSIQTIPEKQIDYIHQWWLPRYWEKGEFLRYDKAAAIELRSIQKQTILTTEDLRIHVPVERPVFKRRYVRHIKPRFVNEVLLQFDETEGKFAQILPDLPTNDLDYLIRGSGFSQWIFSEGIANFLAQENDEYLSLYIARASEVFNKWFEVRKIQIQHSSSGKLGNQLLKNIGGVYGTNFLANRGIPPVLSHFENGRTVLKTTLYAELNRQIQQNKFRDKYPNVITAKLIDKNIIEFGAEVQCTFCNQRSFYKLNDLVDKIKCPICQNIFITPSHNPDEIKWAYRGMGPFSRNNKADGLLCVLLALRFFKITMHPSKITPLLSFELLQNNVAINEVDLAIFFGKDYRSFEPPDLFLAECKTEIDFEDKDIEKMKKLGLLFPNAVLTFATLKSALSNEEKDRIKKLVNFFRKGLDSRPINPVLILTGNELLPANTFTPFANIQHRFIDHLRFSDEVNHLADVTCQHYLGLPSFGSIVEERIETRRKAWEEKRKSEQPIEEDKN